MADFILLFFVVDSKMKFLWMWTQKAAKSLEQKFIFHLGTLSPHGTDQWTPLVLVIYSQIQSTRFLPMAKLLYLTNRFHVAVRLFSKRSQMTSKCGKNKKVTHKAQPSLSLMFLPHFDVLCDLLLNRRTATWNLFVLYNKKIKIHGKNALLFQISPLWQTRK